MSEWQPIETAPKDETEIQLWGDDGWTPQGYYCPHKEGWYFQYYDADWRSYSESRVYGVTHWMPTPDAP